MAQQFRESTVIWVSCICNFVEAVVKFNFSQIFNPRGAGGGEVAPLDATNNLQCLL